MGHYLGVRRVRARVDRSPQRPSEHLNLLLQADYRVVQPGERRSEVSQVSRRAPSSLGAVRLVLQVLELLELALNLFRVQRSD